MSLPRLAVVLAAGLGDRLGDLGRERPKGFIELGGRTLIEMSLARLARAGVERTLIVTGYRAEYYEALAAQRTDIGLVHNPLYARSGSLYSLYVARAAIDGEFLLLESDLVYEQRALTVLAHASPPDALLVSGATNSGDEVYVAARGMRLTGLSKRSAELADPLLGELVGITRLTPSCLSAICAYAEHAFAHSLKVDYEQGLVAATQTRAVHCELVADLLWSEIDDARHLERARRIIYPAILAREESMAPGCCHVD